MKKVKRIKELRLEQHRLNKREGELKQLIHADWIEIKEAARLKNILKGRLNGKKQGNPGEASSWVDGISNGVNSLARIIAQQAEQAIEAELSETIESILDGLFDKKKVKAKSQANATTPQTAVGQ